jgi:hypothetical protein
MNPTRIAEKLAEKRDEMCQAQHENAVDQYRLEQNVLSVLAGEDVDTSQYGFFMAFAKSVQSMVSRIPGGKGLNRAVKATLEYWAAKNMDARVLARVRDDCFSIPDYVPPPPA